MFERSSHKNRPGYYYLGGPKSLKLLLGILYNESKHNILLALVVGKANKFRPPNPEIYIGHNIVSAHLLHKPIQHPLYIVKCMNTTSLVCIQTWLKSASVHVHFSI
jgi:hypothetical protein